MPNRATNEDQLIEKIRHLPADEIKEVEDFVEFLEQRAGERGLKREAAALSDPVFAQIWDNPEDAAYDKL